MQCHRIFAEVKLVSVFILELLHQPVDNDLVEIVTAEVGVPIGREHFEYTVAQLKYAYVMGTAAAVKHCNLDVMRFFIEPIGQGGCRGLVDNPFYLEPCNLTGLFGGLTLSVVKIGRHGNHRLGYLMPEVIFCCFLHFLKHHGRNFLRGIVAVINFHPGRIAVSPHYVVRHAGSLLLALIELIAHKTFDGIYGLSGVGDCLTLGRVAHLAFAALYEGYHAGRCALALAVGNYHGLITLHHGDA